MASSAQSPAIAYSRPISGAEKVAILLLALERSLASQLLYKFDQHDIAIIRAASEQLEPITADDLVGLVEEFAQRFMQGSGLVGNTGEIRQLLDSALESSAARNDEPRPGRPVWEAITELDEDKIVTFLLAEHPQTATYILSRAGPQFAAIILCRLPVENRNDLVRRMVNLKPVSESPAACIESCITRGLLGDDGSAAANEARSRLANIINMMDNEEKNQVIDKLLEEKPAEAEDVKRRLFSFEDIEAMPHKARLTLFDAAATDVVTTALAGVEDPLREMILSSLSSRTRRMVEAELKNAGDLDAAQIKDARRTIAATALQLAERGEIELRAEQLDAA
jgi:flagellar motor switch protein FliG